MKDPSLATIPRGFCFRLVNKLSISYFVVLGTKRSSEGYEVAVQVFNTKDSQFGNSKRKPLSSGAKYLKTKDPAHLLEKIVQQMEIDLTERNKLDIDFDFFLGNCYIELLKYCRLNSIEPLYLSKHGLITHTKSVI